MSQVKYELKPSRWLLLWLLGIHSGALITLLALPLRIPVIVFAIGLILASFIINLRRRSIVCFWEASAGHWCLQHHDGRILTGKLRGDSIRTRHLVILNFTVIGKRGILSVIIPPDALVVDSFRRLRVQLMVTAGRLDRIMHS